MADRFAPALALVIACSSSVDEGAYDCEPIEPRNADEVALCTKIGDPLLARVALPEGPPPPGGWPGVIVLHGSAGLFRPAEDGCSEEMHGRFQAWADLLNARGIAAIFPASFHSRGFCRWSDSDDIPRGYDELERLVTRSFDAAAAAIWLCRQPNVDCTRLAVLGFSNGGSVAMLLMHEDLSVAADPRLRELAVPRFAGGVAYYPGCGLEQQLANRLDDELIDRYFYPQGPMWVPHASTDKLAKPCRKLRVPQVETIAEQRGVEATMFELEIYGGARHGFDTWREGDPKGVDQKAQAAAQERTLARLEAWLK
jgi:dienelactone hydrolase